MALLALLPGVLVVALSFRAGGFFADDVALTCAGLLVVLLLRVTLAEHPFAGLGLPFLLAGGSLALLTVWTLASAAWSDAPARALLEYDRALLYLLAFVVFGAAGRTVAGLRMLARGVALGALVVCLCALVTWILPGLWPTAGVRQDPVLSFPLTYSNALGLLAALGLILCWSLTCDLSELAAVRVAAAVAMPILGATLLFTFSRGAITVAAAGVVTAAIVGRPRALISGLIAAGPATAIAVATAYGADLLADAHGPTGTARTQGERVAMVVGACAAGAGLVRALLLALDGRLERIRAPSAATRRKLRLAVAGGLLAAAVALALSSTVTDMIVRQYDGFVHADPVQISDDGRQRLSSPANNGRIDQWRVALDGFREEPLHGKGAGTFALMWDRERPVAYQLEDAHSLYLESLGELGIVGLVLLAVPLLLILVALLVGSRGPQRTLYGGLFAAMLAWTFYAGVDWHWEMPAVTLWLFAAGGMVVARAAPGRAENPREPQPSRHARGANADRWLPSAVPVRLVAGLACVALAIVPVRIFLSETALRASAQAFAQGDCPRAIDRALDATAALGARPEPYVALAYCDVRLGLPRLGSQAMQAAVARDPSNWELRYGLAVVRGAAGLDPRPAMRAAQRLNPRSPLVAEGVRRFADTRSPQTWRRRALAARLPTDSD